MDNSLEFIDEEHQELLLQLHIHFRNDYNLMRQHYAEQRRGTLPFISLRLIETLQHIQERTEEDLSNLLLTPHQLTILEEAIEAYEVLETALETTEDAHNLLITKLLLSKEDDPKTLRDQIVQQGHAITSKLLPLLSNPQCYSPYFPGFGTIPEQVALCLEKIQDPSSIVAIFEAFRHADFDMEETLKKTLASFGDLAENFLLKRLEQKPISQDNETAALCLASFHSSKTHACAQSLLEDPDFARLHPLNEYLSML